MSTIYYIVSTSLGLIVVTRYLFKTKKRNSTQSMDISSAEISELLLQVGHLYNRVLVAIFTQNISVSHLCKEQSLLLLQQSKKHKHSTKAYYLSEIIESVMCIANLAHEHLTHHSDKLSPSQIKNLKFVNDALDEILSPKGQTNIDEYYHYINSFLGEQLSQNKNPEHNSGILYNKILKETQSIFLISRNLFRAQLSHSNPEPLRP